MKTPTAAASPTDRQRRVGLGVACFALFTDMLIYGLAIPVLPVLPASTYAGPAATGLLFGSYAVAMILATAPAGWLVDRLGPRRPLVVGSLLLVPATLLFALGGPFWLLLAARALQGIAAGFAWVGGLSLIVAITAPRARGRSMAFAMSAVSLGVLIGPPAAGVLVSVIGPSAPFLTAAGLAVADGAARLLLKDRPPSDDTSCADPTAVLRVRGTGAVLVVIALGAGSVAVIEPLLPSQLARSEHLGPVGVGNLFALLVVAGVLVNVVVGALLDKVRVRMLAALGTLLAGTGALLLAVATDLGTTIGALALLGASNALLITPATKLIGEQGLRCSPPAVGAAYAALNLAYAAGLSIGPVVGGAATSLAGYTPALTIVAGLVLTAGAAAVPRLPDHPPHRRRKPDERGPMGPTITIEEQA